MRFLKVILILLLIVLQLLLILSLFGVEVDPAEEDSESFIMVLKTVIYTGIILGFVAFVYHIKSFKYYRKSKRMKKLVKVHAIFWILGILSHVYFLLFGLLMLIGAIVEMVDTVRGQDFIWSFVIVLVVLAYSITSIVETTILKKRIKRYEEEIGLRDEIDTIGISNV